MCDVLINPWFLLAFLSCVAVLVLLFVWKW